MDDEGVDERLLHPLLVIGVFVARLLAIHPFQDGNGRLSRNPDYAAATARPRGTVMFRTLRLRASSKENKDLYYAALLQNTEDALKTVKARLGNVDFFFCAVLKKQKDNLTEKLERDAHRCATMPPLS